jgi:hypothetical protein
MASISAPEGRPNRSRLSRRAMNLLPKNALLPLVAVGIGRDERQLRQRKTVVVQGSGELLPEHLVHRTHSAIGFTGRLESKGDKAIRR